MQKKILDLVWSVLRHWPYSADFASSYFHIFCSQQNTQNNNKEKKNSQDQVKTFVENFLSLKLAEF